MPALIQLPDVANTTLKAIDEASLAQASSPSYLPSGSKAKLSIRQVPLQDSHHQTTWTDIIHPSEDAVSPPAFEDYDVEAVQASEALRYARQGRPGGQVVFYTGYTPLPAPPVPPPPPNANDADRANAPARPTPLPTAPPRINGGALLATAAPSPLVAQAPIPAAAAPTPLLPRSPGHQLQRRSPSPHHKKCAAEPDHPDCQCEAPPCGTKTDVVWVHQTTLIDQPAPPPATPICYTIQQTSTYWQTDLGIWQTTVFPVLSTQWVWEQVPHVVTSASTTYKHKVIPGGGPECKKPPSDWCKDGWQNGIWQGEGKEPCWPVLPPTDDDWWRISWRPFFPVLHNPQVVTLIMIPVFLVVITLLWAVKRLSLLVLLPLQMYTNLVHELAHCFAGLLGGARICSVGIDPGCGPISTMRNGSPMFTLLSGYIGSIIFGTIMVFVAFDERSSKVMYLIHAPLWLIVFWFAEGFLVKLQVFATVSGSIVLWFVFQCRLLRFYILFLGLMSILYVVWDTLDDILYRKQNESDSGLLSRLVPGSRPIIWGLFFTLLALGHLALAICFGLHFFKGDIHAPSVNFLPTFDIGRPDLRSQDAIKKY